MRKFVMLVTLLCIALWAGDVDVDQPSLTTKGSPAEKTPTEGPMLVPEQWSIQGSRDLLFDQTATGWYNCYNCSWDSTWGYPGGWWMKIADNFNVPYMANVDSLVWWGTYW